jgi:hypothetical protein
MVTKKFIVTATTLVALSLNLSADGLKHSLKHVLSQKDDTTLVDLSGLDINAKPVPQHPIAMNTRSPKAIVAIANNTPIRKSVLNSLLKKVSHGKVKDFDLLPPKQKKMLVQQYYLPKYVSSLAIANIPKKERYEIYKAVWMRKKASSIDIKESDIKDSYEKMLSQAKMAHQVDMVPPYDNIKDRIKMQLLDDAMTKYILKDAKVEVSDPNPMQIAGSINGEFVSVDDVEPIVQKISRGKATWNRLNPMDKKRILEMIATKKLTESIALKELSLDEKYNAISNAWLQKQLKNKDIKVSDKELKKAYKVFKKQFKKGKIPSFEEIKPTLKMELARDKYMQQLMKQIKVKLK